MAATFCGLVAMLAQPALAGDAPAAPGRWHLIVHPENSVRVLGRREIERIYRGRTKTWPDGSALVPLNLPGNDALRNDFTREVLQSSVDELATYWNRQYFHGIAPPPVLQSTQAVCAYVAATKGAIGYVDRCADGVAVAVVEVDFEH